MRIPLGSHHHRASCGLVVRDARRCRAPHHEGLRPHPEEAPSAVSKDAATALNPLTTQIRLLAARCVRVVQKLLPSKTEGAGKAGCPLHPQPRAQSVESTRVSHHRFTGTPGLPCAMVLAVSFALSPVTGLVCHRRQRITPPT